MRSVIRSSQSLGGAMYDSAVHGQAVPVPAVDAETTLGARPEVAGQARRTRLALDPRIRAKLERIESLAAAAHAEVMRLGDLIAAERDEQQRLARTEATWSGNYYRDVTKADVAALEAARAASRDETARLTALLDTAQARWAQVNRLAERCRAYLGLPADGRRS